MSGRDNRMVLRERSKVSYRMFDYWIRVGAIVIANPKPGSGNHRKLTGAEQSALDAFRVEYDRIAAETDHLLSGSFFRERLDDFNENEAT